MSDAQVLRELADEVEGLDGQSRDVDAKIGTALSIKIKPEYMWGQSPRCTGSIDAAAKLMPAGWSATVVVNATWSGVTAYPPEPADHDPVEHRTDDVEGQAATEPLARTACALRALAADLEAKTDGAAHGG